MLIHDFKILEEEEQVYIEDNLILYIVDTLKWIDTFSSLKTNRETKGLNYHGVTYFKGDNIKKFKKIIFYWKELFNIAEKKFELMGIYYSPKRKKYLKNRYSKKEVIESLENLINLCDRAEKENKIIEHRGI
ncbi:coproporphyrinogen III oxidase [Fusobacterium pseudoperiodonticum]|uniref:Coproporphyrinogen III oxidase n=1 Tax=Fusobacterium pseudoperiodonticum TaxID=2663009 RepID=A0A2G9EG38_9FUSO|nr:coproporphyrinogen III oxidase [Fusobacterium pseudoperiodonticum]PIM79873.1 coproporphyrinogen III oxidase [Fusobacterium pseudoperiodonticum]